MSTCPSQSSFLFSANATFVAELYICYLKNPDSVDPSWKSFFADLHDDAGDVL
ncbi:MAG: sucA, partial [Nitrobacter vulgaris]|nr:sucA [Nitrobacter vulgaris]